MPIVPSALTPRALIHEISLLLDFISGRSNSSLAAGQPRQFPTAAKNESEMLAMYFQICAELEGVMYFCDGWA